MLPILLAGRGLLPMTCAMPPGQLLVSKQMESLLKRSQDNSSYPAYTIDMLIDYFPNSPRYTSHTNIIFSQRYYFDSTYYKSGGLVSIYIGDETSGLSRFSNLEIDIIQILMSATNVLNVILENRYYGESFPYKTSTTDQLVYLTIEQTIADNAYFAIYAIFPNIEGNLSASRTS